MENKNNVLEHKLNDLSVRTTALNNTTNTANTVNPITTVTNRNDRAISMNSPNSMNSIQSSNSGTGSVILGTQNLTVQGTANEIETFDCLFLRGLIEYGWRFFLQFSVR